MNKLPGKFMMNALALCFVQSGILASMAAAQAHSGAQNHAGMAHLQELEKRFGPHFAARLSSGGANAFQAARMLSKFQSRGVARPPRHANTEMLSNAHATLLAGTASRARATFPVIVNDPSFYYDSTRLTG